MCYISSHLASNPCFSGLASDDKDIAEQTTVRDGELYTYVYEHHVCFKELCTCSQRNDFVFWGHK